MGGAEGVVFALGPFGEAGEAINLAQGADAVAPSGQDFVRIGLVADVPDNAVVRRVEDIMEGDGQLDHAKPGAKMAAGDRDRINGFGAQFVGDLRQIAFGERPQVGGDAHLIEERGLDCQSRYLQPFAALRILQKRGNPRAPRT
ncbi:hypothetical protein GCM10019059_03120 [Camelimonas fluminis]|nr:hypothetical protein GCM10019059_03120 [Camelimonas fluminis]